MKYIIKRFLTVLLILLAPILLLAQTKTTFDRFKNTTRFMTAETPRQQSHFRWREGCVRSYPPHGYGGRFLLRRTGG